MKDSPERTQAIDFVIPWVDGSDPEWQAAKACYVQPNDGEMQGLQNDDRARFEDWGLLKYWFRGVEAFAPWVNKIHFVTWGHLPSWLNAEHPKLNIVRHEDYIPEEYLPTFSCNPIELNFHRIEGLSEQFVYFNDDMLLIDKTRPKDFFQKGLPRATAGLVPFRVVKGDWLYYPLNNVAIINEHFKPRKSLLSHLGKWFNPKYGANNLINALMAPFPAFYGFNEYHLANSFLKSTYETVWAEEEDILDATSRHRFRHHADVTQWLMENWQLASGKFMPRSHKFGRAFYLGGDIDDMLPQLYDYITQQRGKIVCVNDGALTPAQADHAQKTVQEAFEKILPAKCSFEK